MAAIRDLLICTLFGSRPSLKIFDCLNYKTIHRPAPTWQYFGTITCDGLNGIMKLYIDKP